MNGYFYCTISYQSFKCPITIQVTPVVLHTEQREKQKKYKQHNSLSFTRVPTQTKIKSF